ncbi:hypothetical protein DFH28DRAFT_943951 [Melampsora americana]|nr:hypothetical protein DFH28DRAFT_943951 [Melampsora americana]
MVDPLNISASASLNLMNSSLFDLFFYGKFDFNHFHLAIRFSTDLFGVFFHGFFDVCWSIAFTGHQGLFDCQKLSRK